MGLGGHTNQPALCLIKVLFHRNFVHHIHDLKCEHICSNELLRIVSNKSPALIQRLQQSASYQPLINQYRYQAGGKDLRLTGPGTSWPNYFGTVDSGSHLACYRDK